MKSSRRSLTSLVGAFAIAFIIPFTAGATVKKEGSWPTKEVQVDLEFSGKPSEGLKKLAKEAHWSLVLADGVAMDAKSVHVDIEDQPADAVLEALFVGQNVVAHRTGSLITVTPGSAAPDATQAIPPIPAVPPMPGMPPMPTVSVDVPTPAVSVQVAPMPSVRGEDRNVVGGSLVIHKDEIVHTVTVAGGSLKVEGTVTGDLVVAGGSAKVARGARVVGNATVFGGSLKVERDARIDGDVAIAGGSLKQDEGSIIAGRIVDNRHGGKVKVNINGKNGEVSTDVEQDKSRSTVSERIHEFGQSVTKMSLLFVLGCVLLALLAPRMEKVRVEVASRPMRSFALGLVGTLLGSVGALILITILCITVIGIPVAVIGVLFAVLAVYGAIASVLTTAGAAIIGHKTQNPYLHLLLGCAAFLVLISIPYLGGLVAFAVTMIAIGALITTRVGGLLVRQRKMMNTGLV